MKRLVFPILQSPQFLLLSFGVFFSLLWHFSILYVSPFPWIENQYYVSRLFIFYIILHSLLAFVATDCASKTPICARWMSFSLIIFYGIYLAARALDWNVLYYYGGHVDVLFWDNAFYASGVGMLFSSVALLSIISVVFGLAIVAFLIVQIIKHRSNHSNSGRSNFSYIVAYCIAPPLVFILIGRVLIPAVFSPDGHSSVYTKLPPEFHVGKSIVDYLDQDNVEPIVLSETIKSKLASMGLPLETMSTEYPLLKPSIYLDKPIKSPPLDHQPNVIVILAEGLSSYFMEHASMRELDITPNLHKFSEDSLYFTNIVNANTPTLQGQIATLASSLHVFKTTMNMSRWGGHQDLINQNSETQGSLTTRYPFLSILLKKHGYESVHIQGGDARFADTGHYFKVSADYDDFISVSEDKYAEQRKHEIGSWGARDIDTFTVASEWIKTRQTKPFLLTISTLDIHHPYEPALRKPGVPNKLLNTVYSTDAGFGLFWERFIKSEYKHNTIVVVTADHALFPTADYLGVRGSEVSYYDNIPLMIYSPFHKSRMGTTDATRGTQLDIAPTLLQLLGLDSANSFMGLSLLSERKEYPYLFGKINLRSRTPTNEGISWSDEEQTELIKYIRYLASRNLLYPPD